MSAAESRLPHSRIWSRSPAESWKESGMPLGNGRMGAMLVAGRSAGRLALNHERLWRGRFRDRDVDPVPAEKLAEARRLLLEGELLAGGELCQELFGLPAGTPLADGKNNRVDSFQPAGDIHIAFGGVDDGGAFARELDLDAATAEVRCALADGGELVREHLLPAGRPGGVSRFRSDAGPLDLTVRASRVEDRFCAHTAWARGRRFGLDARLEEGIRWRILGEVRGDSACTVEGEALRVAGREVEIAWTIGLDLEDGDPAPAAEEQLAELAGDYETLLAAHLPEHRRLYRAVTLEIGTDRDEVPTDRRIQALRAGGEDEGLLTLYTNFGRYLLIASSRDSEVPANLQGVWNEDLDPAWNCDIHNDINIQMNYWPAEPFGLGECVEPFFAYVERARPHAREVAKKLYGCRGIYMPIQTDPWGRATPESRGWGAWVGGAAWLSQHFWFRWEYSRDEAFLRERAYPVLREVADFFEDYLIEHPDPKRPWLVPVPSQSPENTFEGGSTPVSMCVAATMDVELIADVLHHGIEAAGVLGCDEDRVSRWREILEKLPPLQVGRHGQLQEWLEDYTENEPGHRHISHLYAFHPGDAITVEDEPRLAEAARVSLQRRLAGEGGHTGWSRAWTVCQFARLGEGEACREHLVHLLADFATDAMLDLHPPRIFQIDGNFGGSAGVAEMLLQSHRGVIRLLPALPAAWGEGRYAGLRARGGVRVDARWSGGAPTEALLHAGIGGPVTVQHPRIAEARVTCDGGEVAVEPAGRADRITFDTQAGRNYRLSWSR